MVDVFVAVEVSKFAAAGFLHEDGPGIVMAIVAGHAEGNTLEVFLVRLSGFRSTALECCKLLLQVGIHRTTPGWLKPSVCGPGLLECRAEEPPGCKSLHLFSH